MSSAIPVGISACLLGQAVRFDGGHRRFAFAADTLAPFFHFLPLCPEMGIGLPSPRPALRLTRRDASSPVALVNSRDPALDYTAAMADFAARQLPQLQSLCGFILCARSPSCGMERVKVYTPHEARKSGMGLFAAALMAAMPWLPVEEDGRLSDGALRENFIARVYALHEFNQLWPSGLSRGALVAFHSRYKLLLLAHSQPAYRALGRMVAEIGQWPSTAAFATEYRHRLMALMRQPASRRNHTNVLQHVQGYFSPRLNPAQRAELSQLILQYRQGIQPLLAPLTLINHYLREYPDDYLASQRYFSPYPDALRLRYGH
ncbi:MULTISPECIES: YbgA family protein [Edwardsiella]|uniref:DUF1722 domain-containing protein n=2 Tax=Edwardsiella anguillarum TaxID=1821960 RepID=A0A076LK24_9GAMM|nr:MULTISPECIES: DUF1722 domain-containing protein [Edwardsiella]AKM47199.1 membrane protein [Edwardsiella sp. EA181011]GAJ68968.1 hypothetical protein MA13_contig00016-0033 [Edwardsiella piscicida]AIJ07167.1 Hypothetical protein ETEE_0696 [Edwardsiella anguillarum ET080813]KAB0590979.1 DUF1722 domain-containing protein [Edwardsiella anguillarum]RFT03618.1 DUF1722 domain-containing protein [Edwardsiella anguillarum]